jgi:hypothetical protein
MAILTRSTISVNTARVGPVALFDLCRLCRIIGKRDYARWEALSMTEQVTIKASRYYRPWLAGAEEVAVAASGPASLAELLSRLECEFPSFPALPWEKPGLLGGEVLVHDGRRFLQAHDLVSPGDTLELLPPTAGG